MGVETEISWATSTWNPWWGCQRVSEACRNCYAEALAKRYGHNVWGPEKTTERRFFGDNHWNEPRKWNEKAAKTGEPWRVFCSSMADVFEDRRDLDGQRARLWKLIDETPALTWMLLTKRPEQIRHMVPDTWLAGNSHVWVGTTAEDQGEATKRIPHVIDATWAAVRFVSCEPLLGPIVLFPSWVAGYDYSGGLKVTAPRLDWVIAGGESGPGARPMNPVWARGLRDQCGEAGVAFHFKQYGEFGPDGVRRSKKANGFELDGQVLKAFPA